MNNFRSNKLPLFVIVKMIASILIIYGLGVWGWSRMPTESKDWLFYTYFAVSLLQIVYLTIKTLRLEDKIQNSEVTESVDALDNQ